MSASPYPSLSPLIFHPLPLSPLVFTLREGTASYDSFYAIKGERIWVVGLVGYPDLVARATPEEAEMVGREYVAK